MDIHARLGEVTERIGKRSHDTRQRYLERIDAAKAKGVNRAVLSCGNLAHGFAACSPADKTALSGEVVPNIGIITAYNDMLSAHQPYERFPQLIKEAAHEAGGVAQVAGGVPAMCDGVTQGQPGMQLSLFSRDVIALATAVGLSHNMFDAALFLGICDKIVPGLMIAALRFGHIPSIFVPAGPMPSGMSNDEKTRIRQLYAEGKIGRKELLEAESASYHSPGTCTFYGTANSNQMLMEMMGLHLPGASFVNPNTPLRDALTKAATQRALAITAMGNDYTPIGEVIDVRAVVNGIVGLNATGGSTNHTLHLPAIAAAAGFKLAWKDFEDLSEIIPLLCRVYPNGQADVNHFDAAGGLGYIIRELTGAGLMHGDAQTVWGCPIRDYTVEPRLSDDGVLTWSEGARESSDTDVLRGVAEPFQATGGLKLLRGPLGRAVIKISAVKEERRLIEAPVRIFSDQNHLMQAFKDGELHRDFIAVVRFQGPKANGMPELHKLTPPLGVLQDLGFKVALVTDGRMSGASGKVPAAIHITPEAIDGGPIAKLRDGDMMRLDANAGTLDVLVDADEFAAREPVVADLADSHAGLGRELFHIFRAAAVSAESGSHIFGGLETEDAA